MAIKNLFGRGIGFNGGAIHWVVTRGYASSAAPVPVVVQQPAGGGRRIYDPDEHRRKHRPLTKQERRELDAMFRANARPRYVAPRTTPRPTKRLAPLVHALPPASPARVDRVTAAKQFLALDAIDALLESLERDEPAKAVRVAHLKARLHAERLAHEQQQMARAEFERMESERLAQQEAEDELQMILLAIHEVA